MASGNHRGNTLDFERLHVDCVGGVAGDMLLGALLDLGADAGAVRTAMASLDEPRLRLDVAPVDVGGERALYVRSIAPSEDHGDHHGDPDADHHGGHHHLSDVLAVIDRADAPEPARARARLIFTILGEAEAAVHGGTPASVHLHEVGELDSILDVLGIAVALETLGAPLITASPLPSGRGFVNTSHGRLACPVPAVVQIAERFGLPLVDSGAEPGGDVPPDGETITPTGAAVLAALCEAFGDPPFALGPPVGVGAGTKRFADRPNVVRVYASVSDRAKARARGRVRGRIGGDDTGAGGGR